MLQRYKKVSSNLHFSEENLNFTPEIYNLQRIYYFDSTRLFPEDQLDEALKFGKENGQYSVFILSTGVEVPVE